MKVTVLLVATVRRRRDDLRGSRRPPSRPPPVRKGEGPAVRRLSSAGGRSQEPTPDPALPSPAPLTGRFLDRRLRRFRARPGEAFSLFQPALVPRPDHPPLAHPQARGGRERSAPPRSSGRTAGANSTFSSGARGGGERAIRSEAAAGAEDARCRGLVRRDEFVARPALGRERTSRARSARLA